MSLLLRTMKESDLPAVEELEQCFHHPWPHDELLYELHENPCAHLLVAEEDGAVIGFIDFIITFDSSTISQLAVKGEQRRRGVAQALLEAMERICRTQSDPVSFMTLEVRKSNEAALALYKKNQFIQVTIKKSYYEDGEDAVYMVRSIV